MTNTIKARKVTSPRKEKNHNRKRKVTSPRKKKNHNRKRKVTSPRKKKTHNRKRKVSSPRKKKNHNRKRKVTSLRKKMNAVYGEEEIRRQLERDRDLVRVIREGGPFPRDFPGRARWSQECRVIDEGSNFDGVKLIESQDNMKCGAHSINNLLQRKVIGSCSIHEDMSIDFVAFSLKEKEPSYHIYSCLAGLNNESEGYHTFDDSISAMRELDYNLRRENEIIGFIEWDGRHYVCWKKRNDFWYRIDSEIDGSVGKKAGTICKFTQVDMMEYLMDLTNTSGLEGFCKLLIISKDPLKISQEVKRK